MVKNEKKILESESSCSIDIEDTDMDERIGSDPYTQRDTL